MPDPARDTIRAYYEGNTRLFLRFGSSNQNQVIHRALWPPGVKKLSQALNISNDMLLSLARETESRHIADLGCGVGTTLFYLLKKLPEARGLGLTISRLQAYLGSPHAPPNASLLEADFQHLPLSTGFNLLFSIEAFVHATRPHAYLAEAARVLRPGGCLVLLDDILENAQQNQPPNGWEDVYKRGWHAPNLLSIDQVSTLACEYNLHLREDRDLTPQLRLRALHDLPAKIILNILNPFWKVHPIISSMLGSLALQKCLQDGTITYHWLVFEKR